MVVVRLEGGEEGEGDSGGEERREGWFTNAFEVTI